MEKLVKKPVNTALNVVDGITAITGLKTAFHAIKRLVVRLLRAFIDWVHKYLPDRHEDVEAAVRRKMRHQRAGALVALPGGFSYGDTLGAGEGWARSILFNAALAEQFAAFFNRPDTLALGVCNGCQMMAALAPIIPGTAAWPRFTRNKSEQFEARLSLVEVLDSPSLFFTGMAGSRLPIAVAHGEGKLGDPLAGVSAHYGGPEYPVSTRHRQHLDKAP